MHKGINSGFSFEEHLLPFTSESFVFPSVVKKNIKIKIYRTLILAVFVWMLYVVY